MEERAKKLRRTTIVGHEPAPPPSTPDCNESAPESESEGECGSTATESGSTGECGSGVTVPRVGTSSVEELPDKEYWNIFKAQ